MECEIQQFFSILEILSLSSIVSNLQLTITPTIADYLIKLYLKVLVFPAFMASSEVKAKPGSDVTPVGEDTLDFDDNTLKGEDSCYSLIRSR